MGYRKIKIKIRPGADIEFIGAVRASLGQDAPLMADANGAYTLRHAEHLADLDPFKLMMIEQPLAHDDLRRHAQLQDRLATPNLPRRIDREPGKSRGHGCAWQRPRH